LLFLQFSFYKGGVRTGGYYYNPPKYSTNLKKVWVSLIVYSQDGIATHRLSYRNNVLIAKANVLILRFAKYSRKSNMAKAVAL